MRWIFIFLIVVIISIFGVVKPAWQAEWSEVVEAAKREGTVVVVGPQGNETREALTLGFQKKYPEIKVEHSSSAGAQLPPKLLAEQKAERYSVDVLVQGTTTVIIGLIPVKAVIPIQPYLVGPNSRDSAPWFT
jgi:ABC-type glycerol-3-phosphate transport system substrate-binding protein